ncbi:hypothetical protein GQ42DRAFT_164186 [Ramicandelaber brevisporus]|nr:hypothetical protein GQ42DRAFT_164186 [Ramicandelaber brevisporus]
MTSASEPSTFLKAAIPIAVVLTGINTGTHVGFATMITPGLRRAGIQSSRTALTEIWTNAGRVQPSLAVASVLACGSASFAARNLGGENGPLVAKSLALGAAAGVGMLAWTFAMHLKLNDQLMEAKDKKGQIVLTSAELDEIAKKWHHRQWVRTAIVGTTFGAALYAFSLAK